MKMTGFDVGRKIGSAMAIASAATLRPLKSTWTRHTPPLGTC